MFYWLAVLLVLVLLAAVFSFAGIVASAAGFAKILFVVAGVFAALSFLSSLPRK